MVSLNRNLIIIYKDKVVLNAFIIIKTLQEYINIAIAVHGDKYDYSFINKDDFKNNKSCIDIYCNKHKKLFSQRINCHIRGQGCPICRDSKGNKAVRKFLDEYKIDYKKEYKFKDCKNKRRLPFDFYLPDYNICIEFDGRQHYEIVKDMGGEKEYIQRVINDNIKNQYCKNNNIPLIRIRDIKQIPNILKNKLNIT